jgi:hypothetical protein
MGSLIKNYCTNLFDAEVQEVDESDLDDVQRSVSSDMNQLLMASYTYEEVKKALFNIGDLKAPGLDGLHALFHKKVLEYAW